MTARTLHLIGHAHIDPVWLWRWPEGAHEVIASFRSAADRLDEDADFTFTATSAQFYAWVEAIDPPLFARIQAHVASGRWEIAGGWWVEPDCNLPSGESFVRQALYAQRYFNSRFGVTARIGLAPDSFGHHAMLPQLLAKSGMGAYVFMRPHPHEMGLPGRLFWWESDDASRVLAFRLPYEYVTWGDALDAHLARCTAEIAPPFDAMACFYGVGNHGGGPTRGNLANIRAAQADGGDPRLQFSTLAHFLDDTRDHDPALPLPTVHGDLQHHAPGCYAAHSALKAANRRAENALIAAETWSAIALWQTDHPYPIEALTRAWQSVLFNQFHDILAGTSIEGACDDALHAYGEAMAIAGRAHHEALQRLVWQIDIPDAGTFPLVVFNPHAWAVDTVLEVELNPLPVGEQPATYQIVDSDGQPVPTQPTPTDGIVTWRRRVAFAAQLPPLGYAVYWAVPAEIPHPPTPSPLPEAGSREGEKDGAALQVIAPPSLIATATTLENSLLRVTVDPSGGLRIHDKAIGFDVCRAPAAPYVLDDASDTWGHDVVRYGGDFQPFTLDRVHVMEAGAVRASLRLVHTFGTSRLVQLVTLYPDSRRIDVAVTIDWHEQRRLLKFRFPLDLMFITPTYEIPYGHIERAADGAEEPGGRWIDLSGIVSGTGARYGVSLLNDARYSFAAAGNVMEMTAIRSPAYAHHDPAPLPTDREIAYHDQGIQRFCYTILPHLDGWREAATVRAAALLNQPPTVMLASPHTGTLPARLSLAHTDAAHIEVTAVKRWEDGGDLIVRLVETAKRATITTLHLPHWNRTIPLTFAPCEIKTIRIPRDAAQAAVEVNLLEG